MRHFAEVAVFILLSSAMSAAQSQPAGIDELNLNVFSTDDLQANGRPSVLVHFHGDAKTCERNLAACNWKGILVTVNCNGLSSAYRRPFQNASLFDDVLEHARRELIKAERIPKDASFHGVHVSCFSAGYGAVREILKVKKYQQRIETVVAADSIYASIHQDGDRRLVDQPQMQPFLRFAELAIAGDKTFLISHSQLPVEPYASTVETADYLLARLEMNRAETTSRRGFLPISQATKGNFHVLGFAGMDGEAHLRHLRNIASLWKRVLAPPNDAK